MPATRCPHAGPAADVPARRRPEIWPTAAQATVAVVVIGLVWRVVRYALAFPLWGDEAFLAINFLTRDLRGLARPLEFDQIAPPGFLWAEWSVVRWLGSGELALRLLPFLAGVASLLLFWRFCRQVASRRVVLVAVALFAASYFPVRHANEVKPYSVDLLVALVLLTLGWHVWRRPQSSGAWLALIAAAAAGVWCSYTAVFPASSVAMVLAPRVLRERSPRLLAFGAAYAALLALSFGAVVLTFAGPQSRAAAWLADSVTWKDAFPPLARPWRLAYWLLDVHAGSMMAYPHGTKNFGSTPTFLLVVAGAVAMAWRRPRRPLLLLLLGPLPVTFVAAALGRYPYGTCIRVSIYMAPAFCLLAGEGVVALLKHRGWLGRGPVIIAGLLAMLPLGFLAHDVAMPYTWRDDVEHRQLARSLASRTRPGDRWIVFNGATTLPDDPSVMVSRWVQRVAEVRFYLQSLSPVPIQWEPDPRSLAPSRTGRTWLIIHRHGRSVIYPHERLAAFQRAVVDRIGWPESPPVLDQLADGESLEVAIVPPASAVPSDFIRRR